jgi:hypothetical protein
MEEMFLGKRFFLIYTCLRCNPCFYPFNNEEGVSYGENDKMLR